MLVRRCAGWLTFRNRK